MHWSPRYARSVVAPRSLLAGLTLACVIAVSCAPVPQPNTERALAAAAGTWDMRTLNEAGDSVLVSYQVVATDSRSGWSLNFPGRDPIDIQVLEVVGNDVIAEAGPYASALREGVMVTTRFTFRPRGERMNGEISATYRMPDGEVTVPLRIEGMRRR